MMLSMLYIQVKVMMVFILMHDPGWFLSQAKETGLHWNITTKKYITPDRTVITMLM